jgi:PAS domain S-box-containing protein
MPTDLTRSSSGPALPEANGRHGGDYFARAFHASPALLAIARLSDGTIIETNQAFLQTSGYTREEVVGQSSLDLGIWSYPEQRAALIEQLQRKGSVRNFEAVLYTKAREARYVLLNANLFEYNGEACMLLTAFDLSERRRREQFQEATYEISRVLLGSGDLLGLLAEVHRIVAALIPARNFHVALLDDDGRVRFPYFHDEKLAAAPSQPVESSVIEQVLRSGLSLLTTPAAAAPSATSAPEDVPLPAARLEAPLLIADRAIGMITVQDYDNAQAYGAEAKRLLLFTADQIAACVHRRRTEARQRESQEYFTKLLQTTPAFVIVARLDDGRILEVNPGFERASNYTRAEVVGHTTLELGFWVDNSQRSHFINLMKREGRVRDFEGVFLTKDRKHMHLLLNADVIEMNGIKCMLTIGVDFTERRRREQLQDAVYQISRVLLHDAELPALFAELHRIIAGLMPARNLYVALLSWDGSQIYFPYFVDEGRVTPPPPRAPGNSFTDYVLQSCQPTLTTGQAGTVLMHAGRKYLAIGSPVALWLGVPLLIDGRAIGVIAVQDYHNPAAYGEEEKRLLNFVAGQAASAVQRRQTAEALQRAEHQYRGIFENALEGLFVSSVEGRFISANAAMARILGYASPEALIASVNDVGRQIYADPERRNQFLQLIGDSDEITDFESEIVRPDGSTAWIAESVRVIRNAANVVQHFEGVAADITTKREAARALQHAKEVADAANRAKSLFLASMSHELRTPLNGILGYTQILGRDAALNEKQRSGLEVIHQSAEHLLALINDVLDLAKIEAGKLELYPVDFNLPEFAHSTVEFFAPRARDKNLRLEGVIAPDLPRVVRGDAQRLRQVIFNLLSNAVKFTMYGGVIFTVERAGEFLRFSVSDTGPGIAVEDQGRIFEPFSQLGDQSQRMAGTGLGLSVSRNIVEQMGGKLHLESRPGWGARFWFEVEMAEVLGDMLASRPGAPAQRVVGYEGPRLRVLVADDHEPNRAVLLDLLQPLGFDVQGAQDGQQAVELALENRPDLVLMDMRMPRLDGMAATQAILRNYPGRPPCVIAVSASTHEGPQQAALAAGCAAFLSKPFHEDALFALIEQHLGVLWRTTDRVPGEQHEQIPLLKDPPAVADTDALFELANKGDVMGVRAYAQELLRREPDQTAFAQHVIELANNFRMKAIRTFVSRYRQFPPQT